nr:RNA-directed DNA polymerase, eukaryota [Tanacetum cinerariifolium]
MMSAHFISSLRRDVRGGEESAQLSRISDLLDTVVPSNMRDRRFWDLNSDGCFRVKDVRRMLDDMLLPKSDVPSRWVKQIPIKVNVLAWKISMDRLPIRRKRCRDFLVSPRLCGIEMAIAMVPQLLVIFSGKRVAKRAMVDLVDENEEEEEPIRQCARWTREEEILLTECWIETSENGQIGADRSEDSHKLQAGTSAYEAKKAKEMAMIEFKEMEFLTIDAESLSEPKASIIRNRQEKIIAKYIQQ